ncbi:MAG: Hpt domain-containing protein [Parvularculaceae bacterium]|nr:Hpt domain-containing protein [Parvularculaceae bacterium]
MSDPIDLEHLNLYTVGDNGLLDEILSLFIEQVESLSNRLCEIPDSETWREASHKLKGASRGVGAWALGDLAETAEQAAAGNDAERKAIAEEIAQAAREAIEFAVRTRNQ